MKPKSTVHLLSVDRTLCGRRNWRGTLVLSSKVEEVDCQSCLRRLQANVPSERNQAIWRERQAGFSYREIGRRYHVTPQRVTEIVAKVERAERIRKQLVSGIVSG